MLTGSRRRRIHRCVTCLLSFKRGEGLSFGRGGVGRERGQVGKVDGVNRVGGVGRVGRVSRQGRLVEKVGKAR